MKDKKEPGKKDSDKKDTKGEVKKDVAKDSDKKDTKPEVKQEVKEDKNSKDTTSNNKKDTNLAEKKDTKKNQVNGEQNGDEMASKFGETSLIYRPIERCHICLT